MAAQSRRVSDPNLLIGLFSLFIDGVSSAQLIGYLLLLFRLAWLAVRCAKGLKSLEEKQAPPNVMS